MKILVLGAGGFLGAQLLERFLRGPHHAVPSFPFSRAVQELAAPRPRIESFLMNLREESLRPPAISLGSLLAHTMAYSLEGHCPEPSAR